MSMLVWGWLSLSLCGYDDPDPYRLRGVHHVVREVKNEPVLEFLPGSPERSELEKVGLWGMKVTRSLER